MFARSVSFKIVFESLELHIISFFSELKTLFLENVLHSIYGIGLSKLLSLISTQLEEIKRLVESINWVCEQLRKLEEKYGMSTEEFISKWRSGNIPEPKDVNIADDFITWDGLYEILITRIKELAEKIDRIRPPELH